MPFMHSLPNFFPLLSIILWFLLFYSVPKSFWIALHKLKVMRIFAWSIYDQSNPSKLKVIIIKIKNVHVNISVILKRILVHKLGEILQYQNN